MRHLEPAELARRPKRRHRLQAQALDAEVVDQVAQALPGEEVDERVRHEVGVAGVGVALADLRQGVREALGRAGGEGEHEVQRHAEALGAVHVRVAGRVGDDGVGDEGLARAQHLEVRHVRLVVGRVDAGPPEALEHLVHGGAPAADLTGPDRLHLGDQAGVLHHEGHQLGRVPADRKELQAAFTLDKSLECGMRGDADPMVILIVKDLAEPQKRLNVPSAAYHHDHNIQAWRRYLQLRRAVFPGLVDGGRRPPFRTLRPLLLQSRTVLPLQPQGRADGPREVPTVLCLLQADAQAAVPFRDVAVRLIVLVADREPRVLRIRPSAPLSAFRA